MPETVPPRATGATVYDEPPRSTVPAAESSALGVTEMRAFELRDPSEQAASAMSAIEAAAARRVAKSFTMYGSWETWRRPEGERGKRRAKDRPRAAPSDDQQLPLVIARSYDGLARQHVDVHLAPHADLTRDVDAGFDGEADAGHEQALLARLQIVEVRT